MSNNKGEGGENLGINLCWEERFFSKDFLKFVIEGLASYSPDSRYSMQACVGCYAINNNIQSLSGWNIQ